MSYPIAVRFLHMDRSEALESLIKERAEKLAQVHPGITSCNVAVEAEGRHQHQGRRYVVRIDIHVKGRQIALNRLANEDVFVAARDAFDAAKRALDADSAQREPTHQRPLSA